MTKEEIEVMYEKHRESVTKDMEELVEKIDSCGLIVNPLKENIIRNILYPTENMYRTLYNLKWLPIKILEDAGKSDCIPVFTKWYEDLNAEKVIDSYRDITNPYLDYIDTPQYEFEGDIIITDPCYIIKEDDWRGFAEKYFLSWGDRINDENRCECGGMKFIARETIYGDWDCSTYNTITNEKIGEFCSDAGLVGVFRLKEVLEYNPNLDYKRMVCNGLATMIKDFKGGVEFIVKKTENRCENECFIVEVRGHGVKIKTDEKIEFVGGMIDDL